MQNSEHENKKDAFLYKQHKMAGPHPIDMTKKAAYFTPDVIDIRFGYEYEESIPDWSCQGEGCNPIGWKTKIVGSEADLDLRTGTMPRIPHPYSMRVPYLNDFQIITYNWTKQEICGVSIIYFKGFNGYSWYELKHDPDDNWITIKKCKAKATGLVKEIRYDGECKDLNTLKYICKLLNITE